MAVDIKLSKFDNTPWGFRLSGGVDFTHPLTVVRVARGSLADEAGLQPGDVLIRLNGLPLHEMTHAQAHDKLVNAGNNFLLSVVRNHLNHRMAHQHYMNWPEVTIAAGIVPATCLLRIAASLYTLLSVILTNPNESGPIRYDLARLVTAYNI